MIEIRNCAGFDELEACVQLEIDTWGYEQSEIIPRKGFYIAQRIGGQVMGAFDTEIPASAAGGDAHRLIGFVMALTGAKTAPGQTPTPYLHSHMLAVRPAYRNQGLGARLKWEQRKEALSRGLTRMEWTFDPLEIKNAHLNLVKLGAMVRQYRADFYGVSSSRLQGGLPTDRFLAEWRLDSPRVEAAFAGRPPAAFAVEERIQVPACIYQWKASATDRERALAVQQENRHLFQQSFSRGLAVLGFSRDDQGNGVFELGYPLAE
jgi:predicted GNAT superfamily acetyltransferase